MNELCDCCNIPIAEDETYIGVPESASSSLDHYICYSRARKYPWILLEDPDGRVLIDIDLITNYRKLSSILSNNSLHRNYNHIGRHGKDFSLSGIVYNFPSV